MKKLFLLLSFTCLIAAASYAQGGVYLYLPNATIGVGTAGTHVDEAMLSSVQNGVAVGVSAGNPPSVGKPSVSDIVFSKRFDLSSLRLHFLVLKPAVQQYAEIRYYDAQDALAYTVRVEGVYVTSATQSNGGDACGTGCINTAESYSLTPTTKIIYRNLLSTPNQVLTYNLSTNQCTLTQ